MIVTAASAVPGVELGALTYDADGARATVRGGSERDLAAVADRLTAAGLIVVAGPVVAGAGHPYRDLTVRAR